MVDLISVKFFHSMFIRVLLRSLVLFFSRLLWMLSNFRAPNIIIFIYERPAVGGNEEFRKPQKCYYANQLITASDEFDLMRFCNRSERSYWQRCDDYFWLQTSSDSGSQLLIQWWMYIHIIGRIPRQSIVVRTDWGQTMPPFNFQLNYW